MHPATNDPSAKRSGKLWFAVTIVMLLVALGAAIFITGRMLLRQQRESDGIECGNNVRLIAGALLSFHHEQGTDTAPYPSDIRQLDAMGYTEDINELLTVQPKFAGDWLYFWAADSEDPSAALLISPQLKQFSGDDDAPHVLLTTHGAVRLVEPYVVDAALKASPEPPVRVPAPTR